MKKLTFFATVLATALCMSSCSDDATENDDNDELVAAQTAIKSKLAGGMLLNTDPLLTPTVEKESYTWTNAVDILKQFPESKTPEGVYHNFTFCSNGEPFELVMLYSNGGYRHKLGIYWYDEEGECHEKIIWNELDETSKTWYNGNGGKMTTISRLSDNAGAYKIQLPKGTKFGFYQESYQATSMGWVPVTETTTVDGQEVTGEYKFYTEYNKNWNYPATKTGQAMTTNLNEWTIIGFEDISLTKYSCDKDYNDCVFAITPVQTPDPDPTPEIIDGSVETNLSVSEENNTDKVKFSIHVRAVTDFEVILPVTDPVLADDFAIVAKHDVEYAYAEPMTIAGQTVTLKYSLTKEGYLKITSSGINKQVIDYCNQTYADGLTFESYLFFGKFDLKAQPTVTFTKDPTFYISSCVTNSPEATDVAVNWNKQTVKPIEQLFFTTTGGELVYDHEVYSPYSVEKLKELGWIKTATE